MAEPVIQRQGDRRIVVQLPGVQDTARAKDILGATATLEFRMVDEEHSVADAVDGRVPAGSRLYFERNGRPVLLYRQLMLTGDSIIDAASGIDQQSGSPAVFITLDGKGARIFSERTKTRSAAAWPSSSSRTRPKSGGWTARTFAAGGPSRRSSTSR